MSGRGQRVGLLTAARRVQAAGRMGDSVLAHINPAEARLLDRVTDGGSVNPDTGLLEFWDAGSAGDGHGTGGGSSIGGGGPSASGKGGENAAHGETQGTTAGRDAGYGGGWGGSGGNDGGNGGGGSTDPGSLGPSGGSVAGPSGGLGSGLGTGSLAALSAATAPENDKEPGSGLAGLDLSGFAATRGLTGFGDGMATGMNPEMGGGMSRAIGHNTVSALGPPGGPLNNVNAASAVAAGRTPSVGDDVSDFIGLGTHQGVFGSRAATMGAGIVGTMIGGPMLGAALSLAHGLTAGNQPPGEAFGSTIGGVVGGPLGGFVGGRIGAGLDAMGPASPGAMSSSPAPSGVGGLLSQSADPNPYAQSLGVDSADMQRRGLLNQRRTFTPIRMG